MNLLDRMVRIKKHVSLRVAAQMTGHALARVNTSQASSGRINIFLVHSKLLRIGNNAAEQRINVDEGSSGVFVVVLYKGLETGAKIGAVRFDVVGVVVRGVVCGGEGVDVVVIGDDDVLGAWGG